MASGMDWFRWHHGSVTDPKFQLVARKAGASVAEVLAVWACLLEAASMAEERGDATSATDFEALDCALGLSDGKAAAIYVRMCERLLIVPESGRLVAWDKRQPKRERVDDTAADRQRKARGDSTAVTAAAAKKHAERDMAAGFADGVTDGVTPLQATPANDNHVTPSHATSHQKQPRGEERREEEIDTSAGADSARASPGKACMAMKAVGMAAVNPSSPVLVALLDAGITLPELVGAATDAVEKGKGFAYALATAEGRRRDAAAMVPLPKTPPARASPGAAPWHQTTHDRRAATLAGLTNPGNQTHANRDERTVDIEARVVA